MNKLTKKEEEEFAELFYWENERDLLNWVEQKKKEWQELAVAEYKLKKEMETKFYGSGLDLN